MGFGGLLFTPTPPPTPNTAVWVHFAGDGRAVLLPARQVWQAGGKKVMDEEEEERVVPLSFFGTRC